MKSKVAIAALALLSACLFYEWELDAPAPPGSAPRTPGSAGTSSSAAPPPPSASAAPQPSAVEAGHVMGPTSEPPADPEPAKRPAPTFSEPLAPRGTTRAIVLLYHSIDMRKSDRTVWPWDFENHIVGMRKEHIEIIHLSQLIAFLYGEIEQLPARVAVLTIDDGEVLFHKYAWPILKKHAAPFALGIITQPTELSDHAKALSWAQLGEMLESGLCEIASHGDMHLALTALKPEEIDHELTYSRKLIAERTGFVPEAFMYPLGAFDSDSEARVQKASYRAAFTAVGQPLHADWPRYRIPRFRIERTMAYASLTRFFDRDAHPP